MKIPVIALLMASLTPAFAAASSTRADAAASWHYEIWESLSAPSDLLCKTHRRAAHAPRSEHRERRTAVPDPTHNLRSVSLH